jgi:hypothetical protein
MRSWLAAALLLSATAALADDEVTHLFASAASRGNVHRVIVDIPAGGVTVKNGPADRISVTGEIRRTYDGYREREKQQRIANDINVVIDVNGDQAVIRRQFGPNASSWSARSWHTKYKITVEVPRGLDLDVETRYGELNVDGDFGNIDADLRAGEIHLRTPRANVRELIASVRVGEVHADVGDVREDHEGLFPGRTRFYNASGKSTINVHTTAGEVHVTLTR